jgi:hypothetical protein
MLFNQQVVCLKQLLKMCSGFKGKHHYIERINRELYKMRILDLKNTISKLKNSLDMLKSPMDTPEGKASNLKRG